MENSAPFTRRELDHYRKELEKVLKPLADQKGHTITVGKIKYDKFTFTAQIEVIKAGNKEEAEKLVFNKNMAAFATDGMSAAHYRKKFEHGGKTLTLVGLKPKSGKYPLICLEEATGTRYKIPLNKKVKTQLGLVIFDWDE